jgi:hypothetical protein
MKTLSRLLALAGFLAVSAWALAPAQAQIAQQVTQTGVRLDAGQVVFAPTPSINQAQTTITIPVIAGQCIYVDSLVVGVGENATGATGVQTFTTTNLGGLAYSFFPIVTATSPSGINFNQQLMGPVPLRNASCGVAVTIVSPAQNAALAFPMTVIAHYAPL